MFCSTVPEQIFRPQFFSTVLIYPSAGHEPEMALRGTSKEKRPPDQQITNQKIQQSATTHVILPDVTEEESEDQVTISSDVFNFYHKIYFLSK